MLIPLVRIEEVLEVLAAPSRSPGRCYSRGASRPVRVRVDEAVDDRRFEPFLGVKIRDMGESFLQRDVRGFVVRLPFPPFEQPDRVVVAQVGMEAQAERRPAVELLPIGPAAEPDLIVGVLMRTGIDAGRKISPCSSSSSSCAGTKSRSRVSRRVDRQEPAPGSSPTQKYRPCAMTSSTPANRSSASRSDSNGWPLSSPRKAGTASLAGSRLGGLAWPAPRAGG